MIVSAEGGRQALALLQSRLVHPSVKTRAATTAMAASADQGDNHATGTETETTAKRDEQLAKAQDALRSMKQAKVDMRRQRKAAAVERIERLKRELQSLRLFAGLGNPKAVAREAARIARELAAATRSFQGAARQMVAAGDTGETSAQAERTAPIAADTMSPALTIPATPGPDRAPPTATLAETATTGSPVATANATAMADHRIMEDARLLHRHLKAILEQQRRRAGRGDGDMATADQAVRSAGHALAEVPLGSPTVNLSV